MATSTLTLNKTQLITKALQIVGALPGGQSPTAQELDDCTLHLNLLLKSYLAEGLLNWHQDMFVLFPRKDQASYLLPPGNNSDTHPWSSESAVLMSTLSGEHADGTTLLTLTDSPASSFSTKAAEVGDKIGITLADNTLYWDNIIALDGTDITLNNALAGAAASGAAVYILTDAGIPTYLPGKIISITRRTSDGQDFPLRRLAFHDYQRLTTKTQTGTPLQYTYRETLTERRLYLWPTPEDSCYRLYMLATTEFTIMEDDSSVLPVTPEWYLAIVWELASLLSIEFGCDIRLAGVIAGKAQHYKELALSYGDESSYVRFAPEYSYGS